MKPAFLMRALRALVIGLLLTIGITQAQSATLFGLVDTGELFASSDGGASWSVLSTLPVSDAVAIAAGETSDELFLATRSGTMYRSFDAGVNWVANGTVSASDIVDMATQTNGDVFLLSEAGTLWISTDDGATFTALATLTAPNYASITGDIGGGNMYVLTQTGEISRSTDFGSTWSAVGEVTTSEAIDIRAVGLDLYLLTGSGDVAKSTDHGANWTMIGTLSQVHVSSLTRDGSDLVATTSEGLIATSADGSGWTWVGSINQLTVVSLGNDTPTITGFGPTRPPLVRQLELDAPWPNPRGATGGEVNFRFRLGSADVVTLEIYDVTGQMIARRPNEAFGEPGEHTISWDVGKLVSGIYIVRLVTGTGMKAHRKLTVVR